MKRSEQLARFQSLSLGDLQKEIFAIQTKIQDQAMAVSFGKSKQVRTLRNMKRELARGLTLAHNKLRQTSQEK